MQLPVTQNALALAIGGLALVIATTGTAVAATGTSMNITDPTNSARKAKVDAGGRLLVGDGFGALDVSGVVGSRPSPSTAFSVQGSTSAEVCETLYVPPTGKAAVLTGLNLTHFTTDESHRAYVLVYIGSEACRGSLVAVGNGHGDRTITQNFQAGLNVPAGSQVSFTMGSASRVWYVIADGYTVPASSVPPAAPDSATAQPKLPS